MPQPFTPDDISLFAAVRDTFDRQMNESIHDFPDLWAAGRQHQAGCMSVAASLVAITRDVDSMGSILETCIMLNGLAAAVVLSWAKEFKLVVK